MTETEATVLNDGQTARDLARAVLDETETCTLATATPDGMPEAATVRFVTDDEYTVSVNTATTYRKYENLTANPRVAVVVDGDRENVQLDGEATELDGAAETAVHERYVEKYGPSDYLTRSERKPTPSGVGLSDRGPHSPSCHAPSGWASGIRHLGRDARCHR